MSRPHFFRSILVATFLVLAPVSAQAASCFYVGGNGNVSDGTHWGTSSGASFPTAGCGGGGSAPHFPSTADSATLDANSGGGTMTIDIPWSPATITSSASVTSVINTSNAVGLTNSWTDSGTGGTHTLTLGSATYTNTGNNGFTFTNTNLTFSGASANFVMSATTSNHPFHIGAKTVGSLTLSGSVANLLSTIDASGGTITTLNINGPVGDVTFNQGATTTVTNLNVTGISTGLGFIRSAALGSAATISVATANVTWAAFSDITFAGTAAAVNATNSFDLGNNNFNGGGVSPPTGGGGTHCIGC